MSIFHALFINHFSPDCLFTAHIKQQSSPKNAQCSFALATDAVHQSELAIRPESLENIQLFASQHIRLVDFVVIGLHLLKFTQNLIFLCKTCGSVLVYTPQKQHR